MLQPGDVASWRNKAQVEPGTVRAQDALTAVLSGINAGNVWVVNADLNPLPPPRGFVARGR